MTELTEWFTFGKDSRPVRVLDYAKQKWMPLSDIASAIGYDRTGLVRILDNNDELFAGMKGGVVTTTSGGPQEMTCVNRDGFIGLLMKLDIARIKNDEKRKKILAFQKWGIRLLSSVINGESVVSQKKQLSYPEILERVQFVIDLAQISISLDEDAAVKRVLLSAGQYDIAMLYDVVEPASPLPPLIESLSAKNMIAPSPKPAGMLNASDIGKICGLTPEQVNNKLYNILKYIIKDGENLDEWRITELGKAYGVEKPYRPNPNVAGFYRVFWNREILEKFNVKV